MLVVVLGATRSSKTGFRKLVLEKVEGSWVFLLESISGRANKKSWFSQKSSAFLEK